MVLVRQLPWAYLEVSKNLQAADPALIANLGSAVLAATTELEQKSAALNALSATLRQPYSWLSRAATVFIDAAYEQSQNVLEAAEPMRQLSQALTTLAAELGSAKADAMTARARSLELNHASDELNARVSAQQALLPPGSASPPGAEEDGAAITAAQNAVSSALSDAEQRAVTAWTHAGAAFDFAGNGTPAKVKQWAAPWDPNRHISLSKEIALACTSLSLFGAQEGGILTGSDKRKYPLVLQIGTDVEGNPIVSGRDLPAENVNWHELAYREGYTSFGYKASGWDKLEIIAGGFAGASYTEGSAFDKARLPDINVTQDGGSWLNDPKKMEGGSVKEVTGAPERTAQEELWVAREAGIASGRKAATPDAIGLIDNGLAGVALAMHLNDSMAARYRVVFEEDDAGNLRARLTLYRVTNSPGGPERVEVEAGVADKSGHLAGIPVTGRDRNLATEMMPASG
jgi:hypothetical protein